MNDHLGKTHTLEVWGDFACFSRPEMKVERYSYPCPTPSSARGIFDAVYFKPEFRWEVTQIELLESPSYIALRRNEMKDKSSETAIKKMMSGKSPVEPLWADADKGLLGTDMRGRTQRQTMALRGPRYRITGRIIPRPGHQTQKTAFDEQFVRRARQGKCFQQPYLGCREFVAFFRLVESLDKESPPVAYSQDLGLMLYDVFDLEAVNDQFAAPFVTLFRGRIENGVLNVPPYNSDKVLKPERRPN